MSRRRGLSLIELVVVMSACALLLTLSASFLQRAMRAQSRSRAAAHLHVTLLRLDQSVRNDVHHASTAEADPAKLPAGVILRLEDPAAETIEYRLQERSLDRVQLVAGEIKSRETFSFPRVIAPKILRPQPRLIVLSIAADDQEVEVPPVYVQIEAALPRARLANPNAEKSDE